MKILLPKRRLWRLAVYLVSLVLIVIAIDLVLVQLGRRITPSYATTRITAPTMPGGPIDYIAAIENNYSQGVTPENNAVPLMLEALGRRALASDQPRDGITNRLGMPPLPEHGDYFKDRDDFPGDNVKDEARDDITALLTRPWSATDRPNAAAWLAANDKPLAMMIQASKKTRFYYPYNAGQRPENATSILLPYLMQAQHASLALIARAMLRAEAGEFETARRDLDAAHGWGVLLTRGPTIVDRLVGYGIDRQASEAEQAIATSEKLEAARSREWLTAHRALPALNGFADAIDITERYAVLDSMQFGARQGTASFLRLMQQNGRPNELFLHFVPIRWEHAMQVSNQWYDRVAPAASKPDRIERRKAMTETMKDFVRYADGKDSLPAMMFSSEWPVAMFFPSLGTLDERETSTHTHRVLAELALALAAHKAEHKSYPATLEALKPAHLTDVPADPFTGRPFVYRTTDDGYLLYSVGPDLIDDGGKPVDRSKGDLVVIAGKAPATTRPASP